MSTDATHLDRLMTRLGLANHQLAADVGTSRQTIWKLRTGYSRMLPDWAKRLAPHLGVPWQELVDGAPQEVDPARAELLAAYDAMNEEQRGVLLAMVKIIVPPPKAEPVDAARSARPQPRRSSSAQLLKVR